LQSIPDLPLDILEYVASFNLKTKAALAQSSKSLHQFFQASLVKDFFNTLLSHISRGEENATQKKIASNPKLLLERSTIITPCGNTIVDVTPLELAYGEDDLEMCLMLLPFFDQLPNGRQEAINQITERFPEEKESTPPFDFRSLAKAITRNLHVQDAIEEFREHFKPRVIQRGKHSNIQALLDAMEVYINNFERWSSKQCSLYWCDVVGYLQRMLPACYAQALCQGLFNVTLDNKQLIRDLNFEGEPFYPFNPFAREGIGFDRGIYSYYTIGFIYKNHGETAVGTSQRRELLNLWKTKIAGLQSLFSSIINILTVQKNKA